jgi:dipeptidase
MYGIADAGDGGGYQAHSAYWLFENIGNLMNLFYQGTCDVVRHRWDVFDKGLLRRQSAIEQWAIEIYQSRPRAAAEFLTDYSYSQGLKALETGQEMLAELWTRLALMNNPQTSRVYEPIQSWKDRTETVY